MLYKDDFSCFDDPEILEVIFPLVYSPLYSGSYFHYPSGDPDYFIEVEPGVRVGCEFWVESSDSPTILFFHGNGETASSYEPIAPLYNRRGLNLFVADYRGYGASDGEPTVRNMLLDAHAIFRSFKQIIGEKGMKTRTYIMGRSLGSMPAIELARSYPDEIPGLIVESGSANNFRRLCESLGIPINEAIFGSESPFLNRVRIREARQPTLIIHGECDTLVPLSEGKELYRNSGAKDKKLIIIPGAEHNDIMVAHERLYFDGVKAFIESHIT